MKCRFLIAWVGNCKQDADDGSGFCEEHKGVNCSSCGEQADHTCSESGQLVCGAPLCGDCEHTTHEDGTNGGIGFNTGKLPEGMGTHCRKSDQKHKPWYERE